MAEASDVVVCQCADGGAEGSSGVLAHRGDDDAVAEGSGADAERGEEGGCGDGGWLGWGGERGAGSVVVERREVGC